MKKNLIIIISIAILISLSTFYVGSKAEKHLYEIVELSNQNTAYSLTITDYDKGWLSTTAVIEFNLTMALEPELKDFSKLIFIQKMQHGPLLWTAQGFGFGLMDSTTHIKLPEELQKVIDKTESINDETFKLSSRTSFDGSTKSHLEVEEIIVNENNVKVKIQPTKADFFYNMSGHVTGNINWQGLEVTEFDKQIMKLIAFNAELDQQLVSGELFSSTALFSGTFNSTVKSISLVPEASKSSVILTDLIFSGITELKDELINFNLLVKIADIKTMKLEFTDFIQDISIINLDVQVMQELNEIINKIQQNTLKKSEAVNAALFEEIQQYIPKMLASKPMLKINQLGLNTTEGRIDSQMDISINEDLYDVDNTDTLISAIELEASGHGPELFFVNFGVKETIDQLVQNNMLIMEDDLLKFKFKLINGQSLLNGNPIPIGGM